MERTHAIVSTHQVKLEWREHAFEGVCVVLKGFGGLHRHALAAHVLAAPRALDGGIAHLDDLGNDAARGRVGLSAQYEIGPTGNLGASTSGQLLHFEPGLARPEIGGQQHHAPEPDVEGLLADPGEGGHADEQARAKRDPHAPAGQG